MHFVIESIITCLYTYHIFCWRLDEFVYDLIFLLICFVSKTEDVSQNWEIQWSRVTLMKFWIHPKTYQTLFWIEVNGFLFDPEMTQIPLRRRLTWMVVFSTYLRRVHASFKTKTIEKTPVIGFLKKKNRCHPCHQTLMYAVCIDGYSFQTINFARSWSSPPLPIWTISKRVLRFYV